MKNKTHKKNKNSGHKNSGHKNSGHKKISGHKKTLKRGGAPGQPKISFAYVYYIISYADLINMAEDTRTRFLQYFNRKDQECNCRSLGTSLEECNYPDPGMQPAIPINANQEIVLVLKYNKIVENNIQEEDILGHAIIDNSQIFNKIIGIFSVCQENPAKTGYGSVIFNTILTYLEVKYSTSDIANHYILWLAVLVDNVQFEKVSHIYTSAGFKYPFITFKTPFNFNYPNAAVSLVRNLKEVVVDESSTITAYHKTLSSRYQYIQKRAMGNEYTYKLLFKLDKSVILKGRLFPYLDLNSTISSFSSDPNLGLFREFGGSFKIYNSEIFKDHIVYKLSFETIDNSIIDFTVGDEFEVNIKPNSFTFHSHPFGFYRFYNIIIATPSGADARCIINSFYNTHGQFHILMTVEGIYIMSLHPDAIKLFNDIKSHLMQEQLNIISDIYEYPFAMRAFDWTNPIGDDKNMVPLHLAKYFEWFAIQNKIYLRGKELLNVQFFYWKEINKDTIFSVDIPSIYGSCIVPSNECAMIPRVMGPEYNEFNISTDIPM